MEGFDLALPVLGFLHYPLIHLRWISYFLLGWAKINFKRKTKMLNDVEEKENELRNTCKKCKLLDPVEMDKCYQIKSRIQIYDQKSEKLPTRMPVLSSSL